MTTDTGNDREPQDILANISVDGKRPLHPLCFDHLDVATELINLAATRQQQHNYVEAEALRRRAMNIKQKVLGSQHPESLSVLQNYAEVLHKLKRKREAKAVEQQAKALMP